jgi:hypothetical protein
MVEPAGGEPKRRLQMFKLEVRHFHEDLFSCQACRKQIEHVAYANAIAALAPYDSRMLRRLWTAVALIAAVRLGADSWALPEVETFHSADRRWRLVVTPKRLKGQYEFFSDKVAGRPDAGAAAAKAGMPEAALPPAGMRRFNDFSPKLGGRR